MPAGSHHKCLVGHGFSRDIKTPGAKRLPLRSLTRSKSRCLARRTPRALVAQPIARRL